MVVGVRHLEWKRKGKEKVNEKIKEGEAPREGGKVRRKTGRRHEETGLTQGLGLWAVSASPTLYPNFLSTSCFSFSSLPGYWEEQALIEYPLTPFWSWDPVLLPLREVYLLITQTTIILNNKVFVFVKSFLPGGSSSPVFMLLLSLYMTWYMPVECILTWNRFRKKLFCYLYTQKNIWCFYVSRMNRNIFASTFLLYYILDDSPPPLAWMP